MFGLCLLVLLPPQVQSLLDRIPSAPPEVGADLLIRLAASGKVTDKLQRIDLLKEAWALAPRAKLRFRPSYRAGPGFTDSLSGMLSMAGDLKLDTLSMQVKALRAMRPLDAKRAREWFAEVPAPAPPSLTCADYVAYSVEDYYLLAAEMDFAEALRAVRQVTTPPQALAAVDLVLNWKGKREERVQMASALAGAIKVMRSDSRTVIGSPLWKLPAGAARPLDRLMVKLREEESSALPLLDAWRTFLVVHSSGKVCTDFTAAQNVKHFNEVQLKAAGVTTEVAAITEEEVKPAKVEGTLGDIQFWSDGRTAAIMKEYKDLRFGGGEDMLPLEVRRGSEWELRLRAYLNKLEKWEPDRKQPEIAWFHQRNLIHQALTAIIPPGPLYDTALQSWIGFLVNDAARHDSPAEWVHWVYGLLRRGGAEQEIRRAGDTVMNLLLDAREQLGKE